MLAAVAMYLGWGINFRRPCGCARGPRAAVRHGADLRLSVCTPTSVEFDVRLSRISDCNAIQPRCVCLHSNSKHRHPPLGSSYVSVASWSFFVNVFVVIVVPVFVIWCVDVECWVMMLAAVR